ncbi:MAG: long-chain-fatty-acid--CoA ligase [Thermoplasmata archaeon]|nr:long-chain-fatty-acid--CoA ligase [Thermoplasmata archaeon]
MTEKITLGQMIDRDAVAFPDRDAVVFGDLRWTYAELHEKVSQLACGLVKLGVKKDDKVGLWMHNFPEWIVAWFAIPKIGAVVVPMDTWYKPAEAEYILGHSDSVAVITSEPFANVDFIKMMEDIKPRLPNLRHVIARGTNIGGAMNFEDVLKLGNDWKTNAEFQKRIAEPKPDEVTFILYTSGTTGKPKGAMLTHHNIARNGRDIAEILQMSYKDKVLICVPFSHCFGCVLSITVSASVGACMVPQVAFDPEEVLKTVEREKCTVLHGVPTMFIRELAVLEKKRYDTTSLRTGIMAGAPCPVETMQGVMEKMHCNVSIVYGLTEASPAVTATRFDDSVKDRVETVGRPIPDVEVKIVDADRKEVPRGTPGELACRGYNIMKGYYKNPEATKEAIDEEGWLYTGDMATMDERGYVRIVGRIKDMVIVGGFNVYPREIEELLLQHPKILDVTVVGVPDKELGEVVAALVIPKKGIELKEEEVVDFLYGNVASAKVPRYVQIVESFPVSGRGKVLKYVIREELKKKIAAGDPAIKKVVPTAVKMKVRHAKVPQVAEELIKAGKFSAGKKEILEKFLASINDEQEALFRKLIE